MTELHDDSRDDEIAVSVIVANFNGERFIADSLRSVCEQTLRAIEIIVSDDDSTDSSLQIVKTLIADDNRIRIVECKVNGGPAAARNRALDVARGRWISIIDSDDLIHPDRLRSLVDVAEKNEADIVADDLLMFDTDHRAAPQTLFTGPWGKEKRWISAEEYLMTNNFYGAGPALGYLKPIVRASFVVKQCIRYDERLSLAEDYNFVFRLLMAGARFLIIPNLGYFYRRHQGSLSHRLSCSALRSVLEVERDSATLWPSASLRPLFHSRERSIRRALAFEELVGAIKGRDFWNALVIAVRDPRATYLLRLPLKAFADRLFSRRIASKHERRQVCILTRQRIVGRTNGSSRYLLDIVEFLARRESDVHLVVPSPVTMGRWPILKFSHDMAMFKSIRIRGTIRFGRRYVLACDPRIVARGVLGFIDRLLYRTGWISRPLFRPAPYAIAQALTRSDQLFVARAAPSVADVLIADYCFLTEAYPFALRPDAQRLVIMHDLFSSRSSQFASLNASDSVVSLPFKEEIQLLSKADTIVAIQPDEAAVLQRELPYREIVVAPIAAVPVDKPQVGTSETVLFVGSSAAPNVDGIRWFIEACWPMICKRRPSAMLCIVGSVCNALAGIPPNTKRLNVIKDIDGLYTESAVVISPLRAGSGLKVKLIEGLSKGKAMVVTTTTMQGVADILSGCALVEDSASGFASSVIDLLGDVRKREELGARGILAISRHFSAEKTYRGIARAVEQVGPTAVNKGLPRAKQ
jgi:glycosyltransferase involved in cell wall biosynthesis